MQMMNEHLFYFILGVAGTLFTIRLITKNRYKSVNLVDLLFANVFIKDEPPYKIDKK